MNARASCSDAPATTARRFVVPSWLPRWRLGLALAVVAHALATSRLIAPCDIEDWYGVVFWPLLWVQGLAALGSLGRGLVALAQWRPFAALGELAMALLMLGLGPAAIALNVVSTPSCMDQWMQ